METVNKPRRPSKTKKCIDALFTELEQIMDNDDFQVFKDRFLDILPEYYHNIDHMRIAHFISSLGAYIRKQKIKQEIIEREKTSKSFYEYKKTVRKIDNDIKKKAQSFTIFLDDITIDLLDKKFTAYDNIGAPITTVSIEDVKDLLAAMVEHPEFFNPLRRISKIKPTKKELKEIARSLPNKPKSLDIEYFVDHVLEMIPAHRINLEKICWTVIKD